MSQYTINDSSDCLNTTNSYNTYVSNKYTFADERSQLLKWLSPLDPGLRHWDIQERRVEDVGEWLIRTEEFRRWCGLSGAGEGDKAVLFCYGNPGVGKTFISSLVVDRLHDQTRGLNATVTCFYFDFAARKEQSATNALGSLLKQMIGGTREIPEGIRRSLREQQEAAGGRRPQLNDIVRMLQLITSSQRTYICIDALDECTAAQRFRLFDSLKEILAKSPSARVFITARPHIRSEIHNRLAGRVASLSVSPSRDDIVSYLRVRLAGDETPDAMDEILEAEILDRIPENISQMFLLVALNIDAILQESTIYRRRERLSEITDGLGLRDAYGATIDRIKSQDGDKSRLGMEALMWISHAERPLRADELCHALAVKLGSRDFNVENVPSMSTLMSCCQGLITVDKEALTVRLVHFTLKEYLSARLDIFTRPHSSITEICLTYLNSNLVKALSPGSSPDTLDTSFLEYCSRHWGVHAKRELSDYSRSIALELLHNYDGHTSVKSLLGQVRHLDHKMQSTSFQFSGLHCASFFGIVEVVAALIDMGSYGINEGDFWGETPLAWAARNGHEGVVNILLLQAEVNPDKPNNYGDTPLLQAAARGHDDVVKLLLAREEVNINKPGLFGYTALSRAARGGYEDIVKALLEREQVNPDKPDGDGDTPLSHAAQGGHEGIVKILLERDDVDPDKPDNYRDTPLSHAAQGGHQGIAKVLLERDDVDPNKPNNDGDTPLSHAAQGGHEGIVKILLERDDVDPDKPDNYRDTPLRHAAGGGHGDVVKILLMRDEVNPNKQNNHGNTPLTLAAQRGYEDVVRILLTREEVNPELSDDDGDTPLSCAAYGGSEGVVKILLEQERVNPDNPNYDGQTPLSISAQYGHERLVEILLGREEVNPNKPDNNGRTPLMYASMNNHQKVIELLQPHEWAAHGPPSAIGDTTHSK